MNKRRAEMARSICEAVEWFRSLPPEKQEELRRKLNPPEPEYIDAPWLTRKGEEDDRTVR